MEQKIIARLLILIISLFTSGVVNAKDIKPPFTDYCKFIERDINGTQYGFLAGNKLYYVAGSGGAEYRNINELETLGFTHPLFRDGRARGFGIVDANEVGAGGGVGHDQWGWEFWRHIKVAYGTLIVDGKRYENPEPKRMYWRPDKLVVEYELGGVNIKEEKFISLNDVLSTIITADKAVKIEFQGQSFNNPGMVATFDGDPQGIKMTQSNNSNIVFNENLNAVVLLENGKTMTKVQWGQLAVEGDMMYAGLNFILSSNKTIHSFTSQKLKEGNLAYKFSIDIPVNEPVILSYAVHEQATNAINRIKSEHKNIIKMRDAKTAFMNSVLNEQIPYFRCSDELVNQTYYFLWSIYFMYFTDLKEGWENYPHTQTAINNFMGLHLWDSWAYCAAGSWVADKPAWGFGNALSWQHMVPFKGNNNYLPDNFGTKWYSPVVKMNFQGAVEPIWQQYEQSGDKEFLTEVYHKLLKPLYIDNENKGLELNSAQALVKMANELGEKSDEKVFQAFADKQLEWFPNYRWTHVMDQYEGRKKKVWKDIWDLADLQNNSVTTEMAAPFIDKFVMDTEVGFISPLGLNTRAADSPPNGIFRSSTISCWLAIDGLFRKDAIQPGIITTLNHLNAMTREFGYPVAPEAWDHRFEAWGSRYYNWDIAIVMPMIEWLGGVDYSMLDNSFSFSPHLPDTWDFIEMYVPIVNDGKTNWVNAKVERVNKGGKYELLHSVKGNPLNKTNILPYSENRELVKRNSNLDEEASAGKFIYSATNSDAEVLWTLGNKQKEEKTLVWMTPRAKSFFGTTDIFAENIIPGTELRYTTDGSVPTKKSMLFNEALSISESSSFIIKAFGNDTDYKPFKVDYELTELLPVVEVSKQLKPGLNYKLYELDKKVRELPDFSKLIPIDSGLIVPDDFMPQLNFQSMGLEGKEHFALHISGYIQIEKDDIYNFNLLSDDGSLLLIDGTEVIKLNSVSSVDPWSFDGNIALKKGLHKIDLYYTQSTIKSRLALSYKFIEEHDFRPFPKELFKH